MSPLAMWRRRRALLRYQRQLNDWLDGRTEVRPTWPPKQ